MWLFVISSAVNNFFFLAKTGASEMILSFQRKSAPCPLCRCCARLARIWLRMISVSFYFALYFKLFFYLFCPKNRIKCSILFSSLTQPLRFQSLCIFSSSDTCDILIILTLEWKNGKRNGMTKYFWAMLELVIFFTSDQLHDLRAQIIKRNIISIKCAQIYKGRPKEWELLCPFLLVPSGCMQQDST